jgi:hypothetical protein
MSILEILPAELFRMILQFLKIPKELTVVDNAIVNHRLRSWYLKAIDGMMIISADQGNIFWLLRKNILPSKLYLIDFDYHHLSLIERSRQVLHSLKFNCRVDSVSPIFLFLGHFPHLYQLTISNCLSLTSSDFIPFLKINPQLKSLSLNVRSNQSLNMTEIIQAISQSCINLTELDLSENHWFGDECVSLLTQGQLLKLDILRVGGTSIQEHESVVRILKSFPRLSSLRINECNISMNTKIYFLNEYALPRFRSPDSALQEVGAMGFRDMVVEVRNQTSPHYRVLSRIVSWPRIRW